MGKKALGPEVHKFGGASLADLAAFRRAAAIVRGRTGPQVVTCSAPSGVTDVLLGLAGDALAGRPVGKGVGELRKRYRAIAAGVAPSRAALRELGSVIDASLAELESLLAGLGVLRELTPRTSDLIVSRGERLSAPLFAAALRKAGGRPRVVDATEVIVTDGRFGGASPDLAATDARACRILRPILAAGLTPVVPGFLGSTGSGAVATLGRGGSDLTATLLGRALGARSVSLWKDVPGLLTADPRVVPDARVIPQLNVREAAELAYYGAKVLHPRALIPLAGKRVPLFVRPFADLGAAGTEISAARSLEAYPVKALSSAPAQALVTVAGSGMLGVPGIAARTFETLHRQGTSVSLITQSSSEQSICFTVPEAAGAAAREGLLAAFRGEIARGEIEGVDVRGGLATIAVVGLGMAGQPGIAGRVFSALAAARISVVAIAQGSSELNISFVIPSADAAEAQRRIHTAFQMSKIGGGAAVRPDHVDVVLLGLGQIGRTLASQIAENARARKRIRICGVIDRTGWVFDAGGFSPGRIADLVRAKAKGGALASQGRRGSPQEAIAEMSRHALASPVLVDATADDTTPVLRAALEAGMDLVLANKRPLSGPKWEADELHALAEARGRRIRFEATVGAGLPILDTHAKLVESGDKVTAIEGCVSGTMGYLLTELGHGKTFSEALRGAMAHGFTEPDPRDDLSGRDIARKALILGRLIGFPGEPDDVVVESLVPERARSWPLREFQRRLRELDGDWERRMTAVRAAKASLRYVASITPRKVTVGLRTLDGASPFASLRGTDNQVAFTTRRYRTNPLVIKGPGAGPAVTAGGMMNDILELAGT